MRIVLREDFEGKAEQILEKALDVTDFEVEDLEDIDDFTNAIWNNKNVMRTIAEQFFESLSDWNGDETFDKIRKQLLEKYQELEEEEEDLEEEE